MLGSWTRKFCTMVFAASGGMGKQANIFFFTNACLPAGIEEGPALQPCDWLDQMPLGFLDLFSDRPSPAWGHKVHSRTLGFNPSTTYPDALHLTISEGQVAVSYI